jgi:hypothetical protein
LCLENFLKSFSPMHANGIDWVLHLIKALRLFSILHANGLHRVLNSNLRSQSNQSQRNYFLIGTVIIQQYLHCFYYFFVCAVFMFCFCIWTGILVPALSFINSEVRYHVCPTIVQVVQYPLSYQVLKYWQHYGTSMYLYLILLHNWHCY